MSYAFDDFIVDPAAFRLWKSGAPVRIEPKALQILIFLLERRGSLVTKQELLAEVWPGVSVTENALTRAIAQLRKTLGDDAEAPRYIETVPTRGYRFIGTLRSESPAAPAPSVEPRKRRSALPVAVVISFMGVALLFGAARLVVRLMEKRFPHDVTLARQNAPIAARPFRPSPRFQIAPAFSPDGTWIVYGADVDGTPHLFVAPIDGSSERQLTSGDGEGQPSWSPDGKRIAFTSVRNGGIWLVDAAGGQPEQWTTFGSRPSWSPDGSEIAFQSGENIEYGWNAYEALPPSAIWIVDVASKTTARLTRAGDPAGGHGAPSWRRDGKRLAFSSCDHERCGIFTITRDSSGLTQISTDSRRLASPRFAPDGRTMYYVLARYNDSVLLARSIDLQGNPTAPPRRIRQSSPGVIQHLALSADGVRFAWSVVEEKSDLYVVDVGSKSAPRQLTRDSNVSVTFPSFSPDGKQIAYCAAAAGDDSGIWVMNADGSSPRALVTGPGLKQYVRWGKGASEIYYGAWSVAQHAPQLFRASLISRESEEVANLPRDASAPAISSDGKTIAFNRTIDGKTSVWTSTIDGSSLRRISDEKDLARFPLWSPDGKRLAVQIRRDESSIAILPDLRVLVSGGENWPHSWSSNGREIAFARRRGGVWNVWSVDVASGKPRQVTGFTSATSWVRTPSWSPDGKQIVFEAGSPRGNIWISEPRVAQ